MIIYCIAILFGISAIGIGYYVLTTVTSGLQSYSETYSQNTSKQFEDIFLFIPPKRILEISWILAITVFVILFVSLANFKSAGGIILGLVPAVLGGYIALSSPRYLFNMLKKRRTKKFNIQLVDALLSMSNALKAGFSIMQAFETVAKENNPPISQEFNLFLQQTRLGIPFSEALTKLEERVESEDFSLVAGAIETARKTGGNLMEVFEKISETIRERMRIETRITTLTAQGRLQGIIVSMMPVIIAVVLFVLEPSMMKAFLGSALGLILVFTTITLIVIGGFIIRKIIKIDI